MELATVRLPLRVLADAGGWKLAKWLVKSGGSVYRKQRVAVLKSLSTGAIDHALAPHPGTLVNALIQEGATVDSSEAPIAEVQFCPHSVVFKGVCAVCGEDAEQAHFAETPSLEESRLPVAYNATSLSVTRAEAESVSSQTAQRLLDESRLSLVLDLDHTLVHATDDPRAAAILHHSPENVDKSSVSSFTLGPSAASRSPALMHVKLRPNLSEFLTRLAAKFELHIYTMGSRPYADQIAHLIDPDKKLFSGRITSREDFAEGRCNQKSIQRLFPCDDSMVLIVDDREDVWVSGTAQTYMPNLIRADPYSFWDGLHEAYDRASSTKEQVLPPCSRVPHSPQSAASIVHQANGNSELRPVTIALSTTKDNRDSNGAQHDDPVQKEESADEQQEQATTKQWPVAKGETDISDETKDRNCKARKKDDTNDVHTPAETTKKSVGKKRGKMDGEESAAPAFSAELRRIVKAWWDSDAKPKSSNHLLRLAQVLEECHAEFFRKSQLAVGAKGIEKGTRSNLPFQAPADVKDILATMRRSVLKGCILTFTGIIPTGANPETVPAWNLAIRLGAVCSMELVNGRTTHVVASQHRAAATQKCKDALRAGSAFVVTLNWLEDSALYFEKQDELPYCIGVDPKTISESEFRTAILTRYEVAAEALRSRRTRNVSNISKNEPSPPTKRVKLDIHRQSEQYSPNKSSDIHVLSGDEIGAAMDAAFED